MSTFEWAQGFSRRSDGNGDKPKCTPGNKPCGKRCIPQERDCGADSVGRLGRNLLLAGGAAYLGGGVAQAIAAGQRGGLPTGLALGGAVAQTAGKIAAIGGLGALGAGAVLQSGVKAKKQRALEEKRRRELEKAKEEDPYLRMAFDPAYQRRRKAETRELVRILAEKR